MVSDIQKFRSALDKESSKFITSRGFDPVAQKKLETRLSSGRSSGGSGGGGGGGGGGGITLQQQQEQQRIQQEQKTIQDQVRKNALLSEISRQQEIKSRTIAGQLSARQSSISALSDTRPSTEKLGFLGAAKESGSRLFQRVTGSPTSDRPSFESILDPFDRTVTPKTDIKTFVFGGDVRDTGRKLTDRQLAAAESFGAEVKTFGEIQTEIETGRAEQITTSRTDIEKTLGGQFAGLQTQVDIGSLTLSEAETKGKEFTTTAQEKFTTAQEDIFAGSKDIKGIREGGRSGIRDVIDLGVFVNPLTSFVAAKVSTDLDPLKIDLGQIEKGGTIESGLTQRPSGRTTGFLLGGVIGGGSKLAASGKAATQAEFSAGLREAGLAQKGSRFAIKDGYIDVLSGKFINPEVSAFKQSVSVSKVLKSGRVVTGGQEQFFVQGRTYFSQKPIISGGSSEFSGISEFIPTTSKDLGVGITKLSYSPTSSYSGILTDKGVIGRGVTIKGGDITTETLTSFGTKVDDTIFSTGGRIQGATTEQFIGPGWSDIKIYSKKGVKKGLEFSSGKGFTAQTGIKFTGEIESSSVLKIIKPSKEAGRFTSFKGGGTKTPFSTTFGTQSFQQVSTSIPSFSPPPIIKPSVTTARTTADLGLGLPRMVGGSGLTESQIQTGRGNTFQTNFQQPILSPRSKSGFDNLGFDRGGQELILDSRLKVDKGFIGKGFSSGLEQPLKGTGRFDSGLIQTVIAKPSQGLGISQAQGSGLKLKQYSLLDNKLIQQPAITPRGGFDTFGGFGRGGFFFPPLPRLGGIGTRGKPKRRAKAKVPIRPSFTGIILGIEKAGKTTSIGGFDIGITPGTIRGLETGFNVPKKRKKSKKR